MIAYIFMTFTLTRINQIKDCIVLLYNGGYQ
jgi:hypothetical protein